MKRGTKIAIIILVVIIVVAGGILAYKILLDNHPKEEKKEAAEQEKTELKEAQIFKGTDRPIAVMIDNHSDAWPQA